MSNKNIIFKYNFCDGGSDTNNIGFNGVCSKEKNIEYNIKKRKYAWCEISPCSQYLSGDYSYEQLEKIMADGDSLCYESVFFRQEDGWIAHMGWDNTGQGKPRMLPSWVRENSLCVMTTRNPNASESNRIVFAVFLASYCYQGNEDERIAGYIKAHEKYRIKFTPKEARELLLWKYHANKNNPTNPKWGSGLTRPLSDEGATALLHDIMKIKQGTADAKLAKDFFEHFCELNDFDSKSPPKADGALLYQ